MAAFETGTIVDKRYVLQSMIGQGGMGSVFAANEPELNRTVAIKFLLIDTLDFEQSQARFLREAKILSRLSHPNIVTFYRFGIHEEVHRYIAMEYIKGKSIRQCLDEQGPFSFEQFFSIANQLCSALHAAHQLNIVHRDLKPVNVLLTGDASVKVIDFGLSKINASGSGSPPGATTQTGLLVGSAYYMSPEQCLGLQPDNRSDIYATGCILFEMLTGKPPFEADNPVGLIYKHANEVPPLISDQIDQIPEGLTSVIERCLVKAPGERYQNVVELQRELRAVSEGKGGEIPLYRLARRRKILIPLVASIAALLVVAATGAMLYRSSQHGSKTSQTKISKHRRTTIDGQLQEAMRLKLSGVGQTKRKALLQAEELLDQAYLQRCSTRAELWTLGDATLTNIDAAIEDAKQAIRNATDQNGVTERDAAVAWRILGECYEQRERSPNPQSAAAYRAALNLYRAKHEKANTWHLIEGSPGQLQGIDWDLQTLAVIERYAYWNEHDEGAIPRMQRLFDIFIARCGGPNGAALGTAVDLCVIFKAKNDVKARDEMLKRATEIVSSSTNMTGRQHVDCHIRLASMNLICGRTDMALKEIEKARDLGALLDPGYCWRTRCILKDMQKMNTNPKHAAEVESLLTKFRQMDQSLSRDF